MCRHSEPDVTWLSASPAPAFRGCSIGSVWSAWSSPTGGTGAGIGADGTPSPGTWTIPSVQTCPSLGLLLRSVLGLWGCVWGDGSGHVAAWLLPACLCCAVGAALGHILLLLFQLAGLWGASQSCRLCPGNVVLCKNSPVEPKPSSPQSCFHVSCASSF